MIYAQRWRERAARLRDGGMVMLLVLLIITVFVLPVVVTSSGVIDRIAQDVLLSSILVSGVNELLIFESDQLNPGVEDSERATATRSVQFLDHQKWTA